jgi:hypothetical protein
MSEALSQDQPAAHIAASQRYFSDHFGDELGRSFGWEGIVEDYEVVFGATVSQDFNLATLAMDVTRTGETDVLVTFPQSLEPEHVLLTCIKNAIDELWGQVDEYAEDGRESTAAGFCLVASRRSSEDEEDDQWVDHTEMCTVPIPIDRSRPVIAYLFTLAGIKQPEDSSLAVASIVFATGAALGNEEGMPPFWCYADTVSFEDDGSK